MEFKGTKGRWITEKFEMKGYEKSILILSKNSNKQIAEVNFEYLKNDEYLNNALLISKAPEMLEMLEIILQSENTPIVHRKKVKQLIKEATEL